MSILSLARMHQITYGVYGLLALAGRSIADCLSYGVDFVDGGGPYCINTTSLDYFTFGTEFFGRMIFRVSKCQVGN